MFSSLRVILSMVLLILALLIFPIVRMSERIDDTSARVASEATKTFVNTVLSKGYVDNRDYSSFLENLDASGKTFSVSMEYYKKNYQPLYGNPNDYYTFTDKYEVQYKGYFTKDILNVIFPRGKSLPEDSPERRYNMRAGDLFNVRIRSEDRTMFSRSMSFIYPTSDYPEVYTNGGMVRNEAP